MNVADTNKINSTISYLRSHIYNQESFKKTFNVELSKFMDIQYLTFVPEQYGGWSVYLSLNNNNCNYDYLFMINSIIKALNTIIIDDLKDSVISRDDITNNIFSIISSGYDTTSYYCVIKL